MEFCFRARSRAWLLPGAALVIVIGVAACSSAPKSSSSSSLTASGLQGQLEKVIRGVLPSVVQISTKNSTGSGVVFNAQGDIVTNAHVVGTAKTVDVRPATSDKELSATVVGTFPPDDLAVVRVNSGADSLKPAKFADSAHAQVGEIVLAMGNPLGLTDSVSEGIVSATGRTVTAPSEGSTTAVISSGIQTTAAINPGNSGGALVDLSDQVLGIPTLAATNPQAGGLAPGIGFAIPSNTVKNIAGQLISTGRVTDSGRASLEISAETVANAEGEPAGVGVTSVTSGGAAEVAGIRPGDVIVGVDNQSTPSVAALDSVLATLKPGSKAKVHLSRDGSSMTVEATLGTLTS
jgi:S1-C subfamily serine protease